MFYCVKTMCKISKMGVTMPEVPQSAIPTQVCSIKISPLGGTEYVWASEPAVEDDTLSKK